MGETEATFLNNNCRTLSSPLLPSIPFFILLLPHPIIFSRVVFYWNRPKARRSPGWLAPEQSPCSSQAGNNLSLLENTRLLEGSTHHLPLTPSASEASGLHVPSLLARHPWTKPPRVALNTLFPQLPFRNAVVATLCESLKHERRVKENERLVCALLVHDEKLNIRKNNHPPLGCGFMHFVRRLDSSVQFTAAIFQMQFHASRCLRHFYFLISYNQHWSATGWTAGVRALLHLFSLCKDSAAGGDQTLCYSSAKTHLLLVFTGVCVK